MTEISTSPVEAGGAPAPPHRMSVGRRLLWLGPTGIVVAVALSVVEWLLVRGPENNGSVGAALLACAMTAPVVLARRWPLLAASVVAGAALINGLVFGDLVRCEGAFPAAVYIAFAVGARTVDTAQISARSIAGLLIIVGGLLAQYAWDPALNKGFSFLVLGPGIVLLSWGAGIGWSFLARRRASS